MIELTELRTRIQNFGKSTASYWGCALLGEIGELANLIKKYERNETFDKNEIEFELADIFIYLELTARYIKRYLDTAIHELYDSGYIIICSRISSYGLKLGIYIGNICNMFESYDEETCQSTKDDSNNILIIYLAHIYMIINHIADYFQINLLQAIDEKITIVNEKRR